MRLSQFEESVIEALAQTLFRADVGVGVSAEQANVVGGVSNHLALLPATQQVAVRALIAGFFAGYSVHARRPTASFVTASVEERQAYVTAVNDTPNNAARAALMGLRIMLNVAYLSDPLVRQRVGLAGPYGPSAAEALALI